ncbi:hypothetical protein B296_00022884 [Ensete ventricosum]|uniref:Uncharacterized protein n=1 Tax=Ensete ventricosum TaxID=4639 RepID=A0A427AXK3_ENSVE|nr:hypothetical protein B296_00022884 [Ensete ventricosum]
MKSSGGAGSVSTASLVASTSAVGDAIVTVVEKRPSSSAKAGLRKCLRKATAEQPADAFGSTGVVRAHESGRQVSCLGKDLCQTSLFFTSYFFSSITFVYLQGLHFVSAPINRVHDAGRLVRSQHEKILALLVANKELKASIGQELAAAAEQRAKGLEVKIERMRTELESLRTELKAEGPKTVAAYKASLGFESGLEKNGRVSYEFGYRVTFEQLRGKHLDIMIELDPFVECPEYANIEMHLDQLFDDGTPTEK